MKDPASILAAGATAVLLLGAWLAISLEARASIVGVLLLGAVAACLEYYIRSRRS